MIPLQINFKSDSFIAASSLTAPIFFSVLGLLWIISPGIFEANQLAWSTVVLLVTNIMVWVRARQQIEILGLLPQLAVLMLWCMPALHYWLVEHHPGIMKTPMAVDAGFYFSVALPGVLSLCWAYFLPFPVLKTAGDLRATLHAALVQVGSSPLIMSTLALLCLFGFYGAAVILPSWMQFLGTICRSLLYVLMLVAVFQPALRGRYLWLGGLTVLVLTELIRSTMFGELISLLAILMLYAVFIRQWSVWKIVAAQMVFALLLYWLLAFKFEYRKMAAKQDGFGERAVGLLASAVHPLQHPVSPKILDVVVSRLNQGHLMSLALRYVPAQHPFVHGETIVTAVKGALVPRLLWPDKPRAGGVENIKRFMGVENLDHSINLGVVGEAYVNYSTGAAFALFLICYVLFFRLMLFWMVHQSKVFPFVLLLMPSLFFMVNFVENDVAIMLNHVVKQVMILVILRFAMCGWNADDADAGQRGFKTD